MEPEEIIRRLNIKFKGNYNSDNAYVIDLPSSAAFGDLFTILENSTLVDALEDNQVVTEEGSSLLYEVIDESYIINLIADWESNQYQLIINDVK